MSKHIELYLMTFCGYDSMCFILVSGVSMQGMDIPCVKCSMVWLNGFRTCLDILGVGTLGGRGGDSL
jgi:hypothetical protein